MEKDIQMKSKDNEIAELIKHIAMLTEMIESDHVIIQDLKREIFLERNRNDREADERIDRATKTVL